MNLIRCEMGHFYDADTHAGCPHCGYDNSAEDEIGVTMAGPPVMSETVAIDSQSLEEAVNKAKGDDDSQETIGFYSHSIGMEPVVGWLVCTEGEHYGQDFALKSGRNFIGRSDGMDVALNKDKTISREKHAVVLFEPKSNKFLIQPGDSRELVYVNDNAVFSVQEIKAYDELSLGASKLRFVPFCNSEVNWNTVKQPED